MVACQMLFARPDDHEMWPYHFSLRFLTVVRSLYVWSDGSLDLVANLFVDNMRKFFQKPLISMACIPLCRSAGKVRVLQDG